jgi:hypothetical protein
MKFQIIKLNKFPLRYSALPVLILPVLFLTGCQMKTVGTYSGNVSMTYGDFRAQKFAVENVNLTIEKTGVDKQYNRWNEHKVTFDEKSPLKCRLELELEGSGGDEARNRPEGLYSQVVKRQNCEITKKDGTKVTARAESGEVYVSEDSDGEVFQGTMIFTSQETDVYNEYEITIKARRK